ncbi:hypothetical protein H4219_003761 [Mycoemilia scoparia]|uniref:Uncharacterized protein n=1 Tax=Mycoemilia scoparia TaxID=417184 RepID=A0A9W7ZU59_9FUNG|nr:hypothetical protein H4219_003761 [Mycoemilia scoparia]
MSQRYQPPLPIMISHLLEPQIIEIILYLSKNGYSTFALNKQEQSLVDSTKFGECMTRIIAQRCDLFFGVKQPSQNSENVGCGDMDDCHLADEDIGREFDQVVDFFKDIVLMIDSLRMTLEKNKPQDKDSKDVQQAYSRCIDAVSNMEVIRKEAIFNDGEHFDGGYTECIVIFLKEFVECVAQFDIVTGGCANLLGDGIPALKISLT